MASYVPFLFALLALLAQANATVDVALLFQVCRTSMVKELCMSTFEPVPEARTADLNGLAHIALTTVVKQAVAIHAQVQLLLKKTVDTTIKARLRVCATNYQSAIGNINDSLKALKTKSYSDVNTLVSAAMSDATSCEDGIKEVRSSLTKLSPLSKKFNGLCSISLTISNMCALGLH